MHIEMHKLLQQFSKLSGYQAKLKDIETPDSGTTQLSQMLPLTSLLGILMIVVVY